MNHSTDPALAAALNADAAKLGALGQDPGPRLADIDRPCVCQNCGMGWKESSLLPVKDIGERVAAGETMPAGECPSCGALVHLLVVMEGIETTLRGHSPPDADPLLPEGFGWCLLEIMGHRRHYGRFREESRFGTSVVRIDVPDFENRAAAVPFQWTTHWYSGAAIYCLTIIGQEAALKGARAYAPWPARTPALAPPPAPESLSEDFQTTLEQAMEMDQDEEPF